MENEEAGYQIVLDTSMDALIADCLDYFRVALSRDFPDLEFEKMGTVLGWMISLPSQRSYAVPHVEAKAVTVQEDLFWKKDVLVRYLIIRDDEDLEEDEE